MEKNRSEYILGCRREEACALEWENVNLANGEISLFLNRRLAVMVKEQ